MPKIKNQHFLAIIPIVTEIDKDVVRIKEFRAGTWRFIERERVDVNTKEDLETLQTWLERLEDKERTILKVRLCGTLSLMLHGQLYDLLGNAHELLGALEIRDDELVVIPDDADFSDLGFSGFTSRTVERLRRIAGQGEGQSATARDALALLVRLAGRNK